MSLLRQLDPERAHRLALLGLRLGLCAGSPDNDDPILRVRALGLAFSNPIGLAAGFDKDAVAVGPLLRLGFGFVETGTVTPRPQPGNPRPRLFRLAEDRAVINRMGFNNAGLARYCARLALLSDRAAPLGANLGINKEGADPERDFPALVGAVASLADYVVINVSSPNTPGLRDLQREAALGAILAAVARAAPNRPPLLVKLAPDLSPEGLSAVVETAVAGGAAGLIVSNTTISRPPGLRSAARDEPGGLSGAPLFQLSTLMLARAFLLARGRLDLIGVGGVASGADAFAKIEAGASLVQLYTGFAYEGPRLIGRIKRELAASLRAGGFRSVSEAVGSGVDRIMAEPG
ncbi:MAG: quinone-dependent dihydroorotate dehydrogenase [Acetobacteraceae bacterium]|nr:quinone-dependent dihydroorotate dehydrogenase [Acetobacteraceae bacterium]